MEEALAGEVVEDFGGFFGGEVGGAGDVFEREALFDATTADEGTEQEADEGLVIFGEGGDGLVEVVAEDGLHTAEFGKTFEGQGHRAVGFGGGVACGGGATVSFNRILPELIGDELELGRGDVAVGGGEFVEEAVEEKGFPGAVEEAGGVFEGGAGVFAAQFFEPEADVHQTGDEVFEGLEAAQEVFAEDEDEAEVEGAVFVEFVEEAGGGGAFEGVVDEEELFELVEDEDDGATEGALPFPDGDEEAFGRGG